MKLKTVNIKKDDVYKTVKVWVAESRSEEYIIDLAISTSVSKTKLASKERALAIGGHRCHLYMGECEGSNQPEAFILKKNGVIYFVNDLKTKCYLNAA